MKAFHRFGYVQSKAGDMGVEPTLDGEPLKGVRRFTVEVDADEGCVARVIIEMHAIPDIAVFAEPEIDADEPDAEEEPDTP